MMQAKIIAKFICYALFFGFFLTSGQLSAQALEPGNLFEAVGIKVDVSAEDPVKAKQKGMLVGQRDGFRAVLEKLVPAGHHSALPDLSGKDVDPYVETFSVLSEKSSDTRYVASLSYQFSPSDVRLLLKNNRLPYTESRGKPILVAPVLNSAGKVVLFEDDNAWLAAWQDREGDDGQLVPMFLPLGDLPDMTLLSGPEAMGGDAGKIAEMASRYGTERILVAVAKAPQTELPSKIRIDAILYEENQRVQYSIEISGDGAVEIATLFQLGAAALVERINEDWKGVVAQSFDGGDVLRVMVQTTGPADWAFVRSQLAAEPRLSSSRTLTISRTGAEMELEFSGDVESLKLALRQRDLLLSEDETGAWQLVADPTR